MSQKTSHPVPRLITFIPFLLSTGLGFYLGRLGTLGLASNIGHWSVILLIAILGIALMVISSRLFPDANEIWNERLPFWTFKGLRAMSGLFLVSVGLVWTLMAITPLIGYIIYEL